MPLFAFSTIHRASVFMHKLLEGTVVVLYSEYCRWDCGWNYYVVKTMNTCVTLGLWKMSQPKITSLVLMSHERATSAACNVIFKSFNSLDLEKPLSKFCPRPKLYTAKLVISFPFCVYGVLQFNKFAWGTALQGWAVDFMNREAPFWCWFIELWLQQTL